MTIPSVENLAGLLALTLYIVIKDVVVPLMRRRNHRNANPGTSTSELDREFSAFRAEVRAQREEQLRVNEGFKDNIRRLFERLDKERK